MNQSSIRTWLMSSFSFVHCADLHMESPFRGITSDNPEIARAVRESTFEAFRSVTKLAIRAGAEFLLVAGDIYDAGEQSVGGVLKFRDMLEELHDHGIRTFIVHGNHDPAQSAFSSISWPESVHIFPWSAPETIVFHTSDNSAVSITGQSHETCSVRKNLARHFPSPPPDTFSIAMLHADAGVSSEHAPYAPCTMADLKMHSFAYWALGHVHRAGILDTRPFIVYPGTTQGRSFRETGPRGCYLVKVEHGEVLPPVFHAVDSVRWAQADLPVDDISTMNALEQAILRHTDIMLQEDGGRPLVCRFVLTGRSVLYRELARDATRDDLVERAREIYSDTTPFVWIQDIRTACLPEFDIDDRIKADDFLARVLASGMDILHEGKAGGNRVLEELFSDHKIRKLGISWSDEEFRDMVNQAQILCVDLLEGDSIE